MKNKRGIAIILGAVLILGLIIAALVLALIVGGRVSDFISSLNFGNFNFLIWVVVAIGIIIFHQPIIQLLNVLINLFKRVVG